jgi:glycerol-3-phosphate dehydrogenase
VVNVKDKIDGRKFTIRARSIINAGGAFVDKFNATNNIKTRYRHVFSKGIHLIVPRITRSERVLAFFADDGRLFFAIPMGSRTCIGTTDTPVSDPNTPINDEDRDFVLDNINARLDLERPLGHEDIIAERCGVRPLAVENDVDTDVDFLQLSRKHVIELDSEKPYMSIFGGKLTDCLNVGDEVWGKVVEMGIVKSSDEASENERWYGEPEAGQYSRYREHAARLSLDEISLPGSDEVLSTRLWRRYGMDAFAMLERIEQERSLAEPVIEGAALYRCELQHLADNEMITSLDDLLRRRTKIALVTPREKLQTSEGTMEICRAVFGEQAQEKYDEYFSGRP